MDKYYWNFDQRAETWYESGGSVEECIKQAREMNDADYQTVYKTGCKGHVVEES